MNRMTDEEIYFAKKAADALYHVFLRVSAAEISYKVCSLINRRLMDNMDTEEQRDRLRQYICENLIDWLREDIINYKP
jgi:hypothetical protein